MSNASPASVSDSGERLTSYLAPRNWRIAQAIDQKQSRLMRMTSVFGHELAAMARQRVHLSRGGLSTTEFAAWLRGRDVNGLTALAEGCLTCTPESIFITPAVMLDVAEAELLREKVGAGGTAPDVSQCRPL